MYTGVYLKNNGVNSGYVNNSAAWTNV